MSTSSFSRFFALLSLLCWAAVLCVAILVCLRRRDFAQRILAEIRPFAPWLAWLVALVTTLGSLYYSLIANFLPCELCWYQRICVYPLAVILLIAAVRRDTSIWRYAVPLASIGVVIAAYQSQLQAFPEQSSFCLLSNPCTTRFVWEFGFVSLPLMDLAALLLIIAMTLLHREPATPEMEPA